MSFAYGLANSALADNLRGAWGPVTAWPLIAVHAVLMPDGRVMTYGTDRSGRQTGYFVYDIWDPNAPAGADHLTLDNVTLTDIFCGSQVVLPDGGSVFLAGGDNWTGTGTTNTGNNNSNVLNIDSNVLARGANMNRARWYSSATTLLTGETYIQGGSGGTDRPEIRSSTGVFRLLSGANTSGFDFMYPRNFIAPDGRVFGYDSAGRMFYVDPTGSGAVTSVGQFASGYRGNDASAAMFAPGRILQFGGNSNGAVVIDIRGGTPTLTPTQSMLRQRRLGNATVLADGRVLATGGSSVWNQMTNVSYEAEIWNPVTGQWTVGASASRARLYHSTALLMPDARVLVAGGGAPGPQANANVEIYSPPYLFDAAGQLAARPTISSGPDAVDIGDTIALRVTTGRPIARVTFVKTGSVTHGFNMDQRFVEATFVTMGNTLMVQAPTLATDAPPGYYMMFVIDDQGVPSQARIVKVTVAPDRNPAVVPVISSPGDRAGIVGAPQTIQVIANDPNGDVLGFGASGLPIGTTIDPLTGIISGAPTARCNCTVTVAASDGINTATTTFLWNVEDGAPLKLEPLVQVAPVATGGEVTYTALASNGLNTQYRWYVNDGTAQTFWSSSPAYTHTFTAPGVYFVTVTVIDSRGIERTDTITQLVHRPLTSQRPRMSSSIAIDSPSIGNSRLWVVNPDNDSVSVFDTVTRVRLAEIAVGAAPRAVAIAPNGEAWITNLKGASVSVVNPQTLSVARTIELPRASQPYGIAVSPSGESMYVALGATGRLQRYSTATYAITGDVAVGAQPRGVAVDATTSRVYVSRFVTPPQPGEATAAPRGESGGVPTGGEVVVVGAASMLVERTVVLAHSTRVDSEFEGRGVPNYLGAAAISPDGSQAWVPSKQDNIQRGMGRDGRPLDFQNTVRAISSRIDLGTLSEDPAQRFDHDNASVASAAVYDPLGVYMFVALETSREIAVVDAHRRWQVMRFDTGFAPQALALSPDGLTLYVSNFMDRSVGVYDLRPLRQEGDANVPLVATIGTVTTEKLSAQVLRGKQLFYDARDPRLARDAYMSCASCHNDGEQDGRTWDLTGFGEGLRNTISLRGRASGHGFLHWSNNFDEVQDFEGQIRSLAGGTGLMTDAQFFSGTRNQPLGDRKAGVSADLDALAAYLASLNSFDDSPHRASNGNRTSAGSAGRTLFIAKNCAGCHSGAAFTASGSNTLTDIGTLKPNSGSRLGGPLTGIDVPTLRDVWKTAPYLHDGSAATIEDAILAHRDLPLIYSEVISLAQYVREIGREESSAPSNAAGTGTGLAGNYYAGTALSGAALLTRIEAVNFSWGRTAPAPGVPADRYSVRWSGLVEATVSGSYRFQTVSDDGVRLWVNGVLLISDWTNHAAKTDTSATLNLVAGQRYNIVMEYFENTGSAVARLRWLTPGATSYAAVPASRLYPQ